MEARMTEIERQNHELRAQMAVLTTNIALLAQKVDTLSEKTDDLASKMDNMVALKNTGIGFIAALSMVCMVIGYFLNNLINHLVAKI